MRAAAIVAAMLVVGACTGGDGVDATTTATSAPTTTETIDDAYRWEVGDCVELVSFDDLPYEPFGSAGVVECTQAHSLEVYHVGSFDDGADETFSGAEISAVMREVCASEFIEYIGTPFPESGLDMVLYLPDEREWASGLRYQACVVYDPRSGDDPPLATGSFRDAGASIPFPAVVGDCSNDLNLRGPVLDCALPHRFEHAGTFLLGGDEWPGAQFVTDGAEAGCRGVAVVYVVGGPSVPVGVVIGLPVSIPTQTDWELGIREVVCAAAAVDASSAGLLVIGSFAEAGWQIVEAAQAA